MRRRTRASVLAAVAALAAALLVPGGNQAATATQPPTGCDPVAPAASPGGDTSGKGAEASSCLLPFPNNWHTRADESTDTGLRVNLDPAAMPRNAQGTPIDPTEWNRGDGFSPGSMILSHVPGLDLEQTGAAPLTDIASSLEDEAPIVLLDLTASERWPYWAELDANATDPSRQALIVRPAKNLREGHHYAVALRNLKDKDGAPLKATPEFQKLMGAGKLAGDHPLRDRKRQLAPAVKGLQKAGVRTQDTYLLWDFTVASERGLSERMLHARDDSFEELGQQAPEFIVTQTNEYPSDDPVARSVTGVFNTPSYLDEPGGPPGSGFAYGEDGLPERREGNTQIAVFQCEIPREALGKPAQPSLYGHGLLGSHTEVGSDSVKAMAAEHNIVLCATKWAGMSEDDLGFVAQTLQDLSRFSAVPDRLQQGILNGLWLGRLMTHEDGLAADEAFQTAGGVSVLDEEADLAFYGNSQGGIVGGALTAVSTEVKRAALGVPAMNFSTLLNRSNLWRPFQQVLDTSYPDKLEQQLNLALIQMLWDRGEANGYAHHMTDDPLPGSPAHQVLMHVAFGDHQVSPTAAEVQARTIGAGIHRPAVAEGRNPDKEPYWGIKPLDHSARGSSGLVIWDSGSPYQPLTNTPPTEGHDSHGDPRNSQVARQQAGTFLRTGEIVDVCAAGPCTADPAP